MGEPDENRNWFQVSESDFGFAVQLPEDLANKIERNAPEETGLFIAYVTRRIARLVETGLLDDWRGGPDEDEDEG
ncbi:MAG TPA: hypothetical protein VNY55_16040 [Mycobacterium sp.]|jgi:hypothetical protein|nr:hypothetical protein [Mycobacterium sp.]